MKKLIILASRNMSEVEKFISLVLMMNKGSIIDEGKPSDLIKKHGEKVWKKFFKTQQGNIMNINKMYSLFLRHFI